MSKNTTAQQIAALQAEQAEQRTLLQSAVAGQAALTDLIRQHFGEAAPVTEAKPAKASKAKAPKAEVEGLPFGDLRQMLKAYKVAGKVEAGVSVRQMIDAGRMDAFGNLLDGSSPVVVPVTATTSTKASKKGKKAKGKKSAPTVVAQVDPAAPARERAADAPRRADGTITPKSEWALREALAESGRFDRHEIDRIVALQHA